MEKEFFGRYDLRNLETIHAFNEYLESLKKANIKLDKAEEIYKLSRKHRSEKKLTDYVPGSDMFNQITQMNLEYEEACKKLKELNHVEEVLLRENVMFLAKHSITYVKTFYDHIDDYSYSKEVTEWFYVKGEYSGNIIFEPEKFVLPYKIKETYSTMGRDYIDNYISYSKETSQKLKMYQGCYEQNLDVKTFEKTFGFMDIKSISRNEVITTDGKKYCQIQKLMNEYLIAKDEKYVREDKYTDYPNWITYITFLKWLEDGTYKKG